VKKNVTEYGQFEDLGGIDGLRPPDGFSWGVAGKASFRTWWKPGAGTRRSFILEVDKEKQRVFAGPEAVGGRSLGWALRRNTGGRKVKGQGCLGFRGLWRVR